MITGYRIRLYLLALIILGGFSLLLYRLWLIQIDRQEYYASRLPVTGRVYARLSPARGGIFDRNGVPLAGNKAYLEVGLNLAAIEDAWREQKRLENHGRPVEPPKHVWDPRRDPETDIVAILNEMIFPKLSELGLYVEPEREKRRNVVEAIRRWYRTNRGVIPYPYRTGLQRDDPADFARFAAYAENASEIPGLALRDRPLRIYPLKSVASHILGYIRQAGKEAPPTDDRPTGQPGEPQENLEWKFFENDDTGVAGIEEKLDADLRGRPGERVFLRNEHGRLADEILEARLEPVRGADVFLTIDARVQLIAELALREGKVGRGSVVVMNPNTGEILAMAAVPSFDPNTFSTSISPELWQEIETNPLRPLVNRALSGFAPGSTFKVITALAASTTGDAAKAFACGGSIAYGNAVIKCWIQSKGGAHGTLRVAEALKRSCNCYFYRCGNASGIDSLERMGKIFGLGSHLGIELNYQVRDFMPGRSWWEMAGRGPWAAIHTAQCSIGQAEVLATPLHMCTVAAAVAARGKIYQPTLVRRKRIYSRVKSGGIQSTMTTFQPRLRADLLNLEDGPSVREADLEEIRKGMWAAVNDSGGTAGRARSDLGIAGKTGTAQVTGYNPFTRKVEKDNHAWFIAFAPYDAPEIAVAVDVANGESGGAVAAPIAKRVIERALALEKGNFLQPVIPLDPVAGHFDKLDAVVYEGENLPPPGEEQSEDTVADETVTGEAKPVPAVPDFAAPRIEADETVPPEETELRRQNFRRQEGRGDADPEAPPDEPPGE